MTYRCTASFAWMAFVILAIGGTAWGQNGDIDFQLPHMPGTAIDMCYDTTPMNDSLFVIDEFSGDISHYGLSAIPPDIVLLASFPHPFGAASGFPPSPRAGGIAYNSMSDSLFLLSLTTLEVQETDKLGVPIGLPFPLDTLAGGSPRGLSSEEAGNPASGHSGAGSG